MRAIAGSEEDLCFLLARYMKLKHPNVLFHFDFGSGTKLTMGQAVKQKRLNGRAWPDLFIAARNQSGLGNYNGLFLELKREGERLWKRDGAPASEHIGEQSATLEALTNEGYMAEFAVGYDNAVSLIESYLL